MSSWVRVVSEHPLWVVAGVLALTLFSVAGLIDLRTGEVRLRVDPSAGKLLPAGGPERELYERSRRLFGTDEAIVVALGADDVFTPDVLSRVVSLTRRLEAIDGVQSVLSLATAQNVRAVGDDIDVGPIIPEGEIPRAPSELERLRRETLDNPLYAGTLVSRDSRESTRRSWPRRRRRRATARPGSPAYPTRRSTPARR
jgi:predicted RND superfamily exporter protein